MAWPFTPSPHGLCFTPSSVWSYTDYNIQVPTISSLRVFCWPSASLGRRAIPRQRNAIVVIVSVVRRFIILGFVRTERHGSQISCRWVGSGTDRQHSGSAPSLSEPSLTTLQSPTTQSHGRAQGAPQAAAGLVRH